MFNISSSVYLKDWAEESDSHQNSPTVEGTNSLQWMPATTQESNQFLQHAPTDMYGMPLQAGSFVPVHQSNPPYQGLSVFLLY